MAENIENNGCSQRDNAEHEGYVKASRSFNRIWKERDSAQPKLLEAILYKDNFNRAYKRVKANKGAPGIDGMTIEEALPYLKEHQQELTDRIYRGKYTPSPVRRVEIPKPDPRIAKWGGAGALVPITGFANSVAAPAIEYKKEGQVMGIGCKIFTIAGPVILYGTVISWVLGLVWWIGKMIGAA